MNLVDVYNQLPSTLEVPVICPHCHETYTNTEWNDATRKFIAHKDKLVPITPRGCIYGAWHICPSCETHAKARHIITLNPHACSGMNWSRLCDECNMGRTEAYQRV